MFQHHMQMFVILVVYVVAKYSRTIIMQRCVFVIVYVITKYCRNISVGEIFQGVRPVRLFYCMRGRSIRVPCVMLMTNYFDTCK